MRLLARVLSVLLHPVWMPTLTLFLAFSLDPFISFSFTSEGRLVIYGMVFVMTAVFPIISALMMLRNGLISTLSMPIRTERTLPFVLSWSYCGMTYYLIRRTPMHPTAWALFFGILVALLATTLINLRWKISAHMVGIGGIIGTLLALMLMHGVRAPFMLCALFMVAGALGTSRLYLTDHTQAQIHLGALLGAVCTSGCILFGVWI